VSFLCVSPIERADTDPSVFRSDAHDIVSITTSNVAYHPPAAGVSSLRNLLVSLQKKYLTRSLRIAELASSTKKRTPWNWILLPLVLTDKVAITSSRSGRRLYGF